MVILTTEQKAFLVKYEDKYTIKQFANFFGCTGQEVYDEYNKITRTKEYREYMQNKVDTITSKMRGKARSNEVEYNCEDKEDWRAIIDNLQPMYDVTDIDDIDDNSDYEFDDNPVNEQSTDTPSANLTYHDRLGSTYKLWKKKHKRKDASTK